MKVFLVFGNVDLLIDNYFGLGAVNNGKIWTRNLINLMTLAQQYNGFDTFNILYFNIEILERQNLNVRHTLDLDSILLFIDSKLQFLLLIPFLKLTL